MDRGANNPGMNRVKYLSQFDLLQIRTRLQAVARSQWDVLNPSGLHAALAAPRQAVFGAEMREGLIPKAAILFLRLIQNHPFYDGNKRIAVAALRTFASRNGAELRATDAELMAFASQIATGKFVEAEVLDWMHAHILIRELH